MSQTLILLDRILHDAARDWPSHRVGRRQVPVVAVIIRQTQKSLLPCYPPTPGLLCPEGNLDVGPEKFPQQPCLLINCTLPC